MKINGAPGLEQRLALAWFQLGGVEVRESEPRLDEVLASLATTLQNQYAGRQPSQIPQLQVARRLYRSLGVDPTRTRPSSEALLRRVLKGAPLYRINSVVDTGNLFSLEWLLPVGLYDSGRIQGDVELGVGAEGEGYEGIRKGRVNVAGRVVLRDEQGPFGNPSSDSLRTSIRTETKGILMTIFVPAGYPQGRLEEALGRAEQMQRHFNGGKVTARGLLGTD